MKRSDLERIHNNLMEVSIATTDKQHQDAFYVRKKVFVEEQKVPMELEIDEYENQSTHFVVYNDEKKPIGAGRFRILHGKGKVERVCMIPEFRGQGVGKVLMQAIEKFAKQQAVKQLFLNAQLSAIPFYEKLGYSVVSDEFIDAGIVHKSMEKDI